MIIHEMPASCSPVLFLEKRFLEDSGHALLYNVHYILKQSIVKIAAIRDATAVCGDEEFLWMLCRLASFRELVLNEFLQILLCHTCHLFSLVLGVFLTHF